MSAVIGVAKLKALVSPASEYQPPNVYVARAGAEGNDPKLPDGTVWPLTEDPPLLWKVIVKFGGSVVSATSSTKMFVVPVPAALTCSSFSVCGFPSA